MEFKLFGSAELGSQALFACYLAIVVASLTAVEVASGALAITPTMASVLSTAAMLCILPIFALAHFSFGYAVAVGFLGTVVGFVWLSYFSLSQYDHAAARWSLIASLLAFLAPVLFQVLPARRIFAIAIPTMDVCVKIGLGLAIVVLLLNLAYGFAFVGIREGELVRSSFVRPTILNYATNNVIYALLPFSFAYFAQRGAKLLAMASLLLIPCFYPVLLNKTVLFAALWLPFIFLVFRVFAAKQAVVVSLGIPLLVGLLVHLSGLPDSSAAHYFLFGYINGRMFAIPSIAIDFYADFFAANPLTHFCQVNIVRLIAGCHYTDQLGVVLAARYGVGNLNASLFATEGIASVGLALSPFVTFVCGAVLSLGNSFSRHLPAPLMATSSALVFQALLNVPLSTVLLTNGLLLLFLLWYVCPEQPRG